MPGARNRPFRLGDRSELLAEFVLNTMAFTTRVPRQEDVGHDLLCVLADVRGDLVWAGPSFTVQVKSSRTPLVFEKEHERAWLAGVDNPFFVAVVTRDERRVEIYSTWKRLNGVLLKAARRIVLLPGAPDAEYEGVATEEDGSEQTIPLDRPIISATLDEVVDERHATRLGGILRGWVELDRENIVRRHAGMYWVLGPKSYRTNEPLPIDEIVGFFFWNPKNLEACKRNFGLAATALRVVLRAALGPDRELSKAFAEPIRDLDQVLRSHVTCLDSLAIQVLNEQVGLKLVWPYDGSTEELGRPPDAL